MFNLPPLCLHLAAMCTHFVTISNITYSPISLVFFFSFFHCVVTCDKDVNHIFFIHPSTVWILRSMFVSVSVSCFCLSSTLLQMCCNRHANYFIIIIIIIIYPLSARVIGAPQMVLQPVFSIFPCSPLPSETCQTPGLSIPRCCLPTSSSVCLVFFPLSLSLARCFLATPDERKTWPYHCSLHLFTMVRRSLCGLIACWILARTSSLVTWSLY